MSTGIPISRVTRDGRVERLGEWHHDSRTLELEREGFPFLSAGRHVIEGELPWIFWDMCPAGYLGARLQRRVPHLNLPTNPRDWSAKEVLRVLQGAGGDLAGNLLIGEWNQETFRAAIPSRGDFSEAFLEALSDAMNAGPPSSLGGERPKVLLTSEAGGDLVKFSPPPSTPQGQRWSELLRVEAYAAVSLARARVSAVDAETFGLSGRTFLRVARFDRLPRLGRRGVGTLYWLAMDRYGDVSLPAPEVMRRLADEGLVSAADAETCRRVHAFSAAIGNNDAHLGNYALLFDDHGRASLAPIYDVLPMMLAPRNDELPDAYLQPLNGEIDPIVAPWVDTLVKAVDADEQISDEFKTLWRKLIGR